MEGVTTHECSICNSEEIKEAVLEFHEEDTKEFHDMISEIDKEVGFCRECHFDNIGND